MKLKINKEKSNLLVLSRKSKEVETTDVRIQDNQNPTPPKKHDG